MKIKLILAILFSFLLNKLIGQVISGEENPCPGTNYTYTFSGPSFTNYFLWSIVDGEIISQNTNTVIVRWGRNITENGKWRLRVQYETMGLGGTSGGSTYLDKVVKVKVPSRYSIVGDREIPGNFRGNKTYTAKIVNSNFPATSFLWTTNTGIQITTNDPTFNLNITDNDLKWIGVAGKIETCSEWGEMSRIDISFTSIITGPSQICDEGTYTITNPGTITLENASGIATLTALENNQWKVTRVAGANGRVILRSTINGKTFNKEISIGTPEINFVGENITNTGYYMFRIEGEGIVTTDWTLTSPTNSFTMTKSSNQTVDVIVSNWFSYNIFYLTIEVTTTCGEKIKIIKTLGAGHGGPIEET